ncbi:hypothetical protein GCM10027019_31020 [Melaminivora jejuensis]
MPLVVASPAELYDHLRTVIITPMTSKGFAAPLRVPVTHAGIKGLMPGLNLESHRSH